MNKLSLRIDVTKIDKAKITPRSYEKEGKTVTEQVYNFELIPVKQEKVIKETDKYKLVKVAFLAEKSTKNEDGSYTNGTILGDALEYRDPSPSETVATGAATNVDDIPF